MRAELAEKANSDLQRRFDEQAQELAEARARIAELERLLAEKRGGSKKPGPGGPPSVGPGSGGEPAPPINPPTPQPGIMELRRQLKQALAANSELRALVEELQLRIATLERRCAELEQQLQRALSLAEGREPPKSGQPWDDESATHVQARAAILAAELEQVRRERGEIAEQRDRLTSRLTAALLASNVAESGPSASYSAARTELFSQISIELQTRDRYASWEDERRSRESERRLDPTRTLDEQALVATIAVRWQLMDHAPQSFRQRPRWVVEGLVLDPASERFLIRQSRERVAYRERNMAGNTDTVT